MADRIVTSVSLPAKVHAAGKKMAKKNGRSFSAYLVELITQATKKTRGPNVPLNIKYRGES